MTGNAALRRWISTRASSRLQCGGRAVHRSHLVVLPGLRPPSGAFPAPPAQRLLSPVSFLTLGGRSGSCVPFDAWYIEKRLADRFTGVTVNPSHQEQSILQSSILAYWTVSGIDAQTE